MGIWNTIKSKASEAREERLQWNAAKKDIRKKALVASLVAEREEAMKVAKQRGIERARKPKGISGIISGMQSFSKNLDKIAPRSTKKKSYPTMTDLLIGSRNKPKGNNGMMNFRF